MTRWERFFLVVQRTANIAIILVVIAFGAVAASEWLKYRSYQDEFGGEEQSYGRKFVRTLPYSGQQIETSDGELIAIMQDNGEPGTRVELGGITITNPTTGKFIQVAEGSAPNVVQFELIFDQGNDGKVVGYLATVATPAQYEQGRQDLVVGALPAMTRSVVAQNIRYSDLPRVRGDGSVGLLMWPEEGEAYLVAIRLSDGRILEKVRVALPILKDQKLSQGPGLGSAELGRLEVQSEAPANHFATPDGMF